MNIQNFIKARKNLGLSQVELAKGICTQTTLSRFEKNGQVPSLKILIQLCERIDLPIGELFPKVSSKDSALAKKMEKSEFYLITSEYEKLMKELEEFPKESLSHLPMSLNYYYLQGFSMIFNNSPLVDILFTFDKLLLLEKNHPKPIFKLLALTGLGMAYSREGDDSKAEFYFEQVFKEVYHYDIQTTKDTWRVLNIVYHCGEFYAKKGELDISDALLNYAVSICSENHVTYYLARVFFQLALNAQKKHSSQETILDLLEDAKAFAKINHNQILLDQIMEVKEKI